VKKILTICTILLVGACTPKPDYQTPPLKAAPKKTKVVKTETIGISRTQYNRSVQVDGQVYMNDADAIESLMSIPARSPEQDRYLTMLARKYGFYGKPEKIPSVLAGIRRKN
jgi:hypothetical protein